MRHREGAGEPGTRAAALIARVDAKVQEHDAPLVAEIERIAGPAAKQATGQDFVAAVATVARCAQQLGPVVRQLLGNYPPALHGPFRQLQQQAKGTLAAASDSAVVVVAAHVVDSMAMWHDDLLKTLAVAQAFDAAPSYAVARARL